MIDDEVKLKLIEDENKLPFRGRYAVFYVLIGQ
jgi:hypothetical protein